MEELKPCPYCAGKHFSDRQTFPMSDYEESTTHEVGIDTDNALYITPLHGCVGSNIETLPINYCPMCGRRLTRRTTPENKPLTLKQLRKMDGQPVWTLTETDAINLLQGKPEKYQEATVKLHRHMYLDVFEDTVEYKNKTCRKIDWQYGRTWLAYTRKPKQEDKS